MVLSTSGRNGSSDLPANLGAQLPRLPDVFQRTFSGADKSYVFIDGGAVAYWTTPTGNSNASVSPLLNNSSNRYMAASPAAGVASGRFTSQPLFTTTPSLSDRTYYDWSEVNLGAMNRLMDRTLTSRVQLQQVFFSTPRHTLVAQGDWAREELLVAQRLREVFDGARVGD